MRLTGHRFLQSLPSARAEVVRVGRLLKSTGRGISSRTAVLIKWTLASRHCDRSLGGIWLGADVLVLVTCTNRKTVAPAPALTLRSVSAPTPQARAEIWIKRLDSAKEQGIPAASLYAGDHWHVVRTLHQKSNRAKQRVEVWICSAGYGLVAYNAKIAPYAATFTPNHADSVTREVSRSNMGAARRTWWDALASWAAPQLGGARKIIDLVREHKSKRLIVAASPHYLDAMSDDLSQAGNLLGTEQFAIFCAGWYKHPILDAYRVPCDARLQHLLGGALCSLNMRCVRYALEHGEKTGLELSRLRQHFSGLLDRQPAWNPPRRKPLTDEEVCAFIKKGLSENPRARPSPLLRLLREVGQACEQRRFSELFQRIEGGGRS